MRSELFIGAGAVAAGSFCCQPHAARADAWGAISVDLGQTDTDPHYGVGGGDTEQATAR
jgi:hypothetical protein